MEEGRGEFNMNVL